MKDKIFHYFVDSNINQRYYESLDNVTPQMYILEEKTKLSQEDRKSKKKLHQRNIQNRNNLKIITKLKHRFLNSIS